MSTCSSCVRTVRDCCDPSLVCSHGRQHAALNQTRMPHNKQQQCVSHSRADKKGKYNRVFRAAASGARVVRVRIPHSFSQQRTVVCTCIHASRSLSAPVLFSRVFASAECRASASSGSMPPIFSSWLYKHLNNVFVRFALCRLSRISLCSCLRALCYTHMRCRRTCAASGPSRDSHRATDPRTDWCDSSRGARRTTSPSSSLAWDQCRLSVSFRCPPCIESGRVQSALYPWHLFSLLV